MAVLSYVVRKLRLWSENVIQVLGGGTSSDRGYLRFARVSRGWRALLVRVFPSFLMICSHGKGVNWSDLDEERRFRHLVFRRLGIRRRNWGFMGPRGEFLGLTNSLFLFCSLRKEASHFQTTSRPLLHHL